MTDPRRSWQGHSRRMGDDVGDESTESRSVVQLLRIPPVIRPEHRTSVVVRDDWWLMSCGAADTNGCLDLGCPTFPPNGQVST